MRWRTCFIGEFVDSGSANIQTGPFGTQLKASDYVTNGTPVINVRNIGYTDLRPEKLEYVGDQLADRLSVHLLRENDIVFGRKGAVDRHLFVTSEQEKWMQGSDCIRLRFETEEIIPRFVSYAFLLTNHQQWMLTQSGNKATMASLNQDIIKRIPLAFPPRPFQAEIVKILSTYDDLIENNRRRMALLEDAARQVYQEWFVRLRFPGYEHTHVVDGVPEGWKKCTVKDLGKVITGKTPSTADSSYHGGEIPFIKTPDMHGNAYVIETESFLTEKGAETQSGKFVPANTILVSCIGAKLGAVSLTSCLSQFNQQINAIIPSNEVHTFFCYFACKDMKPTLEALGGGATMPNVNKSKFENLTAILPSLFLCKSFHEFCSPVFRQIQVLALQNQKLRAARDLLLPKLMSGEISV